MIEGAGHACYLDKPEEFKTIVRKFLKKVEG
jgi:pimeloyl-ACP methyl ester carboxylesterase